MHSGKLLILSAIVCCGESCCRIECVNGNAIRHRPCHGALAKRDVDWECRVGPSNGINDCRGIAHDVVQWWRHRSWNFSICKIYVGKKHRKHDTNVTNKKGCRGEFYELFLPTMAKLLDYCATPGL